MIIQVSNQNLSNAECPPFLPKDLEHLRRQSQILQQELEAFCEKSRIAAGNRIAHSQFLLSGDVFGRLEVAGGSLC